MSVTNVSVCLLPILLSVASYSSAAPAYVTQASLHITHSWACGNFCNVATQKNAPRSFQTIFSGNV